VEERLLTSATLHDELMREAGFETEYHRDVERYLWRSEDDL